MNQIRTNNQPVSTTTPPPISPLEPKLYTPTFFVLCLSNMLFAASFTMIIPELPAYLSSLGGAEYKGLIISLFTLTAGISRPFSGKLTDTVGRMPVMIFGTLVCVICSLFYPFVLTVGAFLLLRFFHGFSTGFKPTASTAYIADIVPPTRRGEALGIAGISMNLGASISPPIGSWFTQMYSLDVMFYVSSAAALISILMLLTLKETLPPKQKQPFSWKLFKIKWADVYHQSALAPGFVTLFVYLAFGMMLTITPDQSDFLGISNKGYFFVFVTASSVLSRFVAGRVSDQFGRIPVMQAGIILMCVSLTVLAYATTPFLFFAGASILGFSQGIVSPAVFAWAIDRSPDDVRGRAIGTIYIALEISIGAGAFFSAYFYDNNPQNFSMVMWFLMVATAIPSFFLFFYQKNKRA
ncbi:MAG: MFS transporter [Saprospiraceae bacterium]